jgi:hypothetical protein
LLWTRPSSRGWTEPCELTTCVMPAVPHRAAAQTRRRLRAGHRAEPVVCRCRCLPQRACSLALQWCRTFVPTSARRVSARRRHPHTEHATVERRPCLSLAWGRVSTNPCRAHVVGVVPSPRLCRRPFTHTTNIGSRPCPSWPNQCTRTHTHARSFTGVGPPTNAAGPFFAVFPFLCSLA